MGRLLRTLALAGIAYALWQYLKNVLAEPEADPVATAPYGAPAPAAAEAVAEAEGSSAAEKTAAASPASSSNGSGSARSKAELYEEAQRLGIEGRSKMSKAELERAIRDAG